MSVDNEDWLRARTWDVRNSDGSLVQTVAQLEAVLGVELALRILDLPAGQACPPALRAELELALDETKGLETDTFPEGEVRESVRTAAAGRLDLYATALMPGLVELWDRVYTETLAGLETKAFGELDLRSEVRDRLMADVEWIVGEAAGWTLTDLGGPRMGQLDLLRLPELSQAVHARLDDLAEAVLDRVTELRLAAASESASELADVIVDLQDQHEGRLAWAQQVARTQATRAVNEAGLAVARAAGSTTKSWLSRRDGSVRHTHVVADGQAVGIEESFLVGGYRLRYPGDPKGPPELVLNCRCVLLFGRAHRGVLRRLLERLRNLRR